MGGETQVGGIDANTAACQNDADCPDFCIDGVCLKGAKNKHFYELDNAHAFDLYEGHWGQETRLGRPPKGKGVGRRNGSGETQVGMSRNKAACENDAKCSGIGFCIQNVCVEGEKNLQTVQWEQEAQSRFMDYYWQETETQVGGGINRNSAKCAKRAECPSRDFCIDHVCVIGTKNNRQSDTEAAVGYEGIDCGDKTKFCMQFGGKQTCGCYAESDTEAAVGYEGIDCGDKTKFCMQFGAKQTCGCYAESDTEAAVGYEGIDCGEKTKFCMQFGGKQTCGCYAESETRIGTPSGKGETQVGGIDANTAACQNDADCPDFCIDGVCLKGAKNKHFYELDNAHAFDLYEGHWGQETRLGRPPKGKGVGRRNGSGETQVGMSRNKAACENDAKCSGIGFCIQNVCVEGEKNLQTVKYEQEAQSRFMDYYWQETETQVGGGINRNSAKCAKRAECPSRDFCVDHVCVIGTKNNRQSE